MNRTKEEEFQYLIDFFKAADVSPESVVLSECPDFIAVIDGQTVGIELTIARHDGARFGALQIEHAQAEYARALRKCVEETAKDRDDGLIIGISFDDGIPVISDHKGAIPRVATLIAETAYGLPNPGSITIWSEKWAAILGKERMKTELWLPLPEFIQNICLYRDGKHDIKVTGGRGGIKPDFDDSVLLPILRSKNDRLKNYVTCDSSWLVIITGVPRFEGHSPQEESANVALVSFATHFGKVNVTQPIPSDFDATYLFEWPSQSVRLSGE